MGTCTPCVENIWLDGTDSTGVNRTCNFSIRGCLELMALIEDGMNYLNSITVIRLVGSLCQDGNTYTFQDQTLVRMADAHLWRALIKGNLESGAARAPSRPDDPRFGLERWSLKGSHPSIENITPIHHYSRVISSSKWGHAELAAPFLYAAQNTLPIRRCGCRRSCCRCLNVIFSFGSLDMVKLMLVPTQGWTSLNVHTNTNAQSISEKNKFEGPFYSKFVGALVWFPQIWLIRLVLEFKFSWKFVWPVG